MEKSEKKGNKCIGEYLKTGRPEIEQWIKRYSKAEMATLYNCHRDTLRRRMLEKPMLMQELSQLGYKHRDKGFTKAQVRAIFKHLGDPDFPIY